MQSKINKMKNTLWFLGGVVAILLVAVILGNQNIKPSVLGGEIPFNTLSILNTSSTVTSTAASVIMASSSGSQYRAFTNLGAQAVYLSFGTSTFVAQTGYVLAPSSTLVMTEANGNLFRHSIYAIIDTGVATKVSMVELK